MRMLCLFMLLILLAAVGILALENRETISIRFFGQNFSAAHSVVIGIVFLVGVVSGWMALAFARRTLRGAVEY